MCLVFIQFEIFIPKYIQIAHTMHTHTLQLKLSQSQSVSNLISQHHISQQIRNIFFPTDLASPQPSLSFPQTPHSSKFKFHKVGNSLFITSFQHINNSQEGYPSQFFYSALHEIDSKSFQPKLIFQQLTSDQLSTESTKQRIQDIELTLDGKYVFMVSRNNVYRYALRHRNYLNDFKSEGLENDSSRFYLQRDSEYILKMEEEVEISELKAHPFGDYLIGIGQKSGSHRKYLLKIMADDPDFTLVESSLDCLRSSPLLENSLQFDLNTQHRLVTISNEKEQKDGRIFGNICLWNTEQQAPEVIDSFTFSKDSVLKYLEGTEQSFNISKFQVQSIKIGNKGDASSDISVTDAGNGLIHVLKIQHDKIQYQYSFSPEHEQSENKSTIQTQFIPELDTKLVYSSNSQLQFYKVQDGNLDELSRQKEIGHQDIKSVFYDESSDKVCSVSQNQSTKSTTISCSTLLINCQDQDQFIQIQDCINHCQIQNQYFNSKLARCEDCDDDDCDCDNFYDRNGYTGQCTFNCDKIPSVFSHKKFFKEAGCLPRRSFWEDQMYRDLTQQTANEQNTEKFLSKKKIKLGSQSIVGDADSDEQQKEADEAAGSDEQAADSDQQAAGSDNNHGSDDQHGSDQEDDLSPVAIAFIAVGGWILIIIAFFIIRFFVHRNRRYKRRRRGSNNGIQPGRQSSRALRQGIELNEQNMRSH